HVNRGATYILVYSILGAFYLVVYAGIHRLLPANSSIETLLNTLLIFILATIFIPINRRVQKMVDTVFYGGWYDYRSAVRQITQGLEQITDLRELARTVGDRLVSTLRLQDTCVFLRDSNGVFSVTEVSPRNGLSEQISANLPVLPMSSLQYLLNMGESGGISSMREALSGVSLTKEEYQLLNSEQVHLWLPIIGHGQVQGYLALGPKFGGDIFSGEDMDILRVIAWQIAPVMENIHLLTQLREHAAELEQRVQERTSELHEEKERVEAILASVGDGVIVTDLNGNIVTVNSAFEKQCGYSASYLKGQKFYAQLAQYNDAGVLDDMQATLKRGEDWGGELLYPRNGSKPYNIQLTIAPVYNQGDQMIGYVGSQRDITQERELNRLKDQFISDVSHELRTPATNLSLYIELMEHGPEGKRVDYLNILKGQTTLLVKLIEDILDLSRLEMGKSKKIRFTPVDLNLLTEQVVTALLPMAEASGLSLDFAPQTDLQTVYGEQNQLARVITNLVSNSIRYTLEGKVSITTYNQDHHVCLQVQDTGIGIDPEDQPYLFDRFFRGRQVRQSKIHGTGLGLAIVKEIVDLHEGNIQFDSEVGKGTTFQVWLPVYQDPS
ncbi:MAG: ATP-binding protein, partial [Omnitrophica WOR_2 bacterium]